MIDCHIHYSKGAGEERFFEVIKKHNMKAVALQCIPKGDRIPVEKDAFEFKRNSPVPVYVFGGLDRNIFRMPKENMGPALANEIDRLMAMGCSGIKMLEGKPSVRKNWPVPDFDDPLWEAYWSRMEKDKIPLLFHVNDPEEFWDETKVSEFAKKAGWYYDSSFINNEEQYRQILAVLKNHPALRITFAHFFFLSKQLDRLGKILDAFPNVRIDITPGMELYLNLSDSIGESRLFFNRYQDRIMFGTDIGSRSIIEVEEIPLSIEESDSKIQLIRNFITAQEDYGLKVDDAYVKGVSTRTMHSLNLSGEIQKRIFEDNFLEFVK